MKIKLIFGFPLSDPFMYGDQLYYSIKKFCHNPPVFFASNEGIGHSYSRLIKVSSKREYRHHQFHNFLFDIFEEIKNMDFDYFVKLDSDCLFANFGFENIFSQKFDFLDSVSENDAKCVWSHAKRFLAGIADYQRLMSDLKLKRKDSRISGCLGAFQVYSKKSICFIADSIKIIENSPGYLAMKRTDMSLSELLVPNLLKDAGFKYHVLYLHESPATPRFNVRWRPYIGKEEAEHVKNSDLCILYHPVRRSVYDETRDILLKNIGHRGDLWEFLKTRRLSI